MATLDVQTFRGEIPGTESRKLPNEAAELALNCRFSDGNLNALSDLAPQIATLRAGIIRSIFLYKRNFWFAWNSVVHAINSPVAQDPYDRVYFTGDGVPKVTSNLIGTGSDPLPSNAYTLGIQAPAEAVSVVQVSYSGASPTDYSDDETRYYAMTYGTEYGEEGPPGPASAAVEIKDPVGDTVVLGLPIPSTNTENLTRKFIYRAVTSGAGTDFYLIGVVPLSQTTFTDSSSVILGKLLDTEDFAAPPANMQGLVMMPNGIAAGFAGNEVTFSEPYLPYANRTANRRSTISSIKAIAVTGSSLVAATEAFPVLFTGVAPDSISEVKIEQAQACVSGRSMVDMGEFVIYASPDGLMAIADSRAEIITASVLGKREWAQFSPETIHAYFYEGQYVAFYGDAADDGNGVGGFIFDPRDGSLCRLGFYATAGYTDLLSDSLYLVVRESGVSKLVKFDSATALLKYRWRSKKFLTQGVGFSCFKIDTDDPTLVGIKVFADGQLAYSRSWLDSSVCRIGDIRFDRELQFELFGTAEVRAVRFATEMSELS